MPDCIGLSLLEPSLSCLVSVPGGSKGEMAVFVHDIHTPCMFHEMKDGICHSSLSLRLVNFCARNVSAKEFSVDVFILNICSKNLRCVIAFVKIVSCIFCARGYFTMQKENYGSSSFSNFHMFLCCIF